jgi:hypothetical protein
MVLFDGRLWFAFQGHCVAEDEPRAARLWAEPDRGFCVLARLGVAPERDESARQDNVCDVRG